MPVRIRSNRVPGTPAEAVRRVRAADLPAMIAVGGRREHLPFATLAKEWGWWPDDRPMMVAEPPVSSDFDSLCRIAAVAHALCDRDGVAVPEWVKQYRSGKPLALSSVIPTHGPVWERIVNDAPPTCEFHNVWFDRRSIADSRPAGDSSVGEL